MSSAALQLLAAIVFALGASGLLLRRNLIVALGSLWIASLGAVLLFVAFSRESNDAGGQAAGLVVAALSLVQVAVGVAILGVAYRARPRLDADSPGEGEE
ncbi:MAG: NADH-quinone oxidoreductase subunit K [Planctomycetota bacterium]